MQCPLWLSLLLLTLGAPVAAQDASDLGINSERYIVVDADTGDVFAQKDANDRVDIASLTKVFTAILAIESAPLDTEITTDESDLFGASSTTMGFGPDETFTLEELLYGMLLPSGNDAAHAIARHLGHQPGDSPDEAIARFMGRLNQRIQDMGLRDTHLVNPHGLGEEGHYSSAWDIAAFMTFALEYPTFVDAIGTQSYTTDNGNYTVTNTNKILSSFDDLLGGKTGYDYGAGWCLIEVARRDDRTMVAVTLDGIAPDDWYNDNRMLLDYAFKQDVDDNSAPRDRVSYLDPDAAVIERNSESGASFHAVPSLRAPEPAAAAQLASTQGAAPRLSQPRLERAQLWVTIGISLAILSLRGVAVFTGRGTRASAWSVDALSRRR